MRKMPEYPPSSLRTSRAASLPMFMPEDEMLVVTLGVLIDKAPPAKNPLLESLIVIRPSLPFSVVVRVPTVLVIAVEPIDQPPMVPLVEKTEPVNEPVVAVTVPVKEPVVAMTVPVKVPVVAVIVPVTFTPVAVSTPVTALTVNELVGPVMAMPTVRVPAVMLPASRLATTKPEIVVCVQLVPPLPVY